MKKMLKLYVAMQTKLQSVTGNEKGATMVEYALMVALIAAVCAITVDAVGLAADGKFEAIRTAINNA